jgi:hypothetical protein
MTQCIIISGGPQLHNTRSLIRRHLGPYRIASSLIENGFSAIVIDFTQYFTIDELITTIKHNLNEETLWVGFSSTFFFGPWDTENLRQNMYPMWTLDDVDKLFYFIKSNSSAKLVYAGASGGKQYDPQIDCNMIGYGDNAVVAYSRHLKYNEPLIHYTISSNGNPSSIVIDSSKYPEPDVTNISTHWWREDFNIIPGEALPIELARGCIFKCKFCSYSLLGKKKGTYVRDMDQIRDDLIRTWETHGTTNYYIVDDTFNDDCDKIDELHKLFTSLPFKLNFSCYLRIDLINKFPHQADQLADMGLVGNFFGLETLNWESAKAIGKGLHPNKVKDRLLWLKEKWNGKVNMGAGFIYGLPYDTIEYFDELEKWILDKDNPLSYIETYPLRLFYKKHRDASEFTMNPEIYGYEIDVNNHWKLKSQGLDYLQCLKIADDIALKRRELQKPADFLIMTQSNCGIDFKDLLNVSIDDMQGKFDMVGRNEDRLTWYKERVGAYNV